MRSPAMGSGGGGGGRGGETPQPNHRSASRGGGRGGGGKSELFICFTPRSISMCAPSARSLPSPGRSHRDPAAPPLSASLSRRLRSSGSLKGGQSPMFPARKGGAFRAAEPSSPKVTCIGQVRVKSKAKNMGEGAALRSRSDSLRRRQEGENGIGEEERECLRSQSWVYQLPTSIYEALRSIGSEFNCFLPCGKGRSPCFSSSKAREEKGGVEGRGEKRSASSCGVVFARWLMAIEESEDGEGGEMAGLVVGERERELDLVLRERENWEAKVEEVGKEGWVENKGEVMVVEEVVCVPPKNALLLMRCRSDPVKMAALTSRLFGSPAMKVQAEEEEEEEKGDGNEERKEVGRRLVVEEAGEGDGQESKIGESERKECETQRSLEGVTLSVSVKDEEGDSEDGGCVEKEKGIKEAGFLDESLLTDPNEVVEAARTELQEKQHEKVLKDETVSLKRGEEKEEEDMKGKESSSCSSEYNKEEEENIVRKETEETRSSRFSSDQCNKEGIRRSSSCKEKERRRHSFSTEREARRRSFSTEREASRASISVGKEGRICWSFIIDREEMEVRSEELAAEAERDKKKEQFLEEEEIRKAAEVEKMKRTGEAGVVVPEERREGEEEGGGEREEEEEEKEKRGELPDCLLLMTYEPKLSMEVSRETWVCSTNFPYGHHHHPKGKAGVDSASDHGRCVKVDKVGDGRCVESMEMIQSIESSPQHLPPPPPVPPLPSAVEETLVSGVAAALVPAFEPFVLTRCNSEPVRPSARSVANGGFWKNRHKPVDAVGF